MVSEVEKEERRQARLRAEKNFKKNFGFEPSNGFDENRKKIETALVKKVIEGFISDLKVDRQNRDELVEISVKDPTTESLPDYDKLESKIRDKENNIISLGKDAHIMGFIIPGINDQYHD